MRSRDLKILFFIVFLSCTQLIFSQNTHSFYGGAATLGKGDISLLEKNIYALYSNQAGLASIESFGANISYTQLYQIPDLHHVQVGLSYGSKFGGFGFQVQNSSNAGYDHQKFGLAYGRKILEKLDVGAQFDLFNVQIDGYGATQFVSVEFGAMSDINKQLSVGLHVFSPGQAKIIDSEIVSTKMRFGIAYSPSKYVSLLSEIEKNISQNPILKFGIQYMPNEVFVLRVGTNTGPSTINFGFGLNQKQFLIDLGFELHQQLGLSSSIGISYPGIKSIDP